MDDTITQILEACSLARELESSLPSTAIHPHFLLKSCENIAEAFVRVIHSLHNVDQYSFFTTANLAPMLFENYATADLLPPRTSDLEIHMTAMEQSGAAASCYISAHGTDTEAAVAGSSGAERRPARAGSSDQRSNRRRPAGIGSREWYPRSEQETPRTHRTMATRGGSTDRRLFLAVDSQGVTIGAPTGATMVAWQRNKYKG